MKTIFKILFLLFPTVALSQQLQQWPIPNATNLSGLFGEYRNPIKLPAHFHGGIDILATTGTPIVAAASGTINTVGISPTLGNYVIVQDENGFFELYAENNNADGYVAAGAATNTIGLGYNKYVTQGAPVAQGVTIATAGISGSEQGASHLHFEVRSSAVLSPPTSSDRYNPLRFYPSDQASFPSPITIENDPSYVFLPFNANSWAGTLSSPVTNDTLNGLQVIFNFQNGVYAAPATYILAGQIDSLIHAYEPATYSAGATYRLGLYNYNETIQNTGSGVTNISQFAVTFNTVYGSDYTNAWVLYSNSSAYPSTISSPSEYYYRTDACTTCTNGSMAMTELYTVNNFSTSSQGAPLSIMDQYGNFITNHSSTVPANGGYARINAEADLPDGSYQIGVTLGDVSNNVTKTNIPIIIDNFLPYVQSVVAAQGTSVFYSTGWPVTALSSSILANSLSISIANNIPAPANSIALTIAFSEQMDPIFTPFVDLGNL